MKATDLRISNYVWNSVQKIPVKVDLKILSDQLYGVYPWQPIPLTEEWLVKFGFSNPISYKHYFINLDDNNIIFATITSNNIRIGLSSFNQNGRQLSEIVLQIQYVNQLQNLYFALTGEELEIKL